MPHSSNPGKLRPAPLKVVFGRDSRPSGTWVRDAAVAALVASGLEVVDLNIVTTPGVAMMVRHLNADAGVIATASHNPIEWNGLKFLNRDAVAPPAADAQIIKDFYDCDRTDYVPVEHLIPPRQDTQTHALHVKRVLDYVDVLGISSKRYKVVLDSVNGAGCVATATLLSKLGCQLVHLNSIPNGLFPHEPEPTEKNLTSLSDEVRRQRAAVGFAQDPDADRLAIVDENGVYIGEEYSLALCAKWILSRLPGIAVTNLSSSRMLDDIAAAHNSRVIRTPVGEANVIQTMLATGAVHRRRRQRRRDRPPNRPRPRQPGRHGLRPATHGIHRPIHQPDRRANSALRDRQNQIPLPPRRCPARRRGPQTALRFRENRHQDGIRIDFPNAWLHARPSNTEPIMRIIAEAPDRSQAEKIITEAQAVVDETI